nr:type I restriction-modification system subunit M N-terminal domain-containing protein [Aquibium microcysteis]
MTADVATEPMRCLARGRSAAARAPRASIDGSGVDTLHLYVRGKYRDVILPMMVLRRLDAVLEPIKADVQDDAVDDGMSEEVAA